MTCPAATVIQSDCRYSLCVSVTRGFSDVPKVCHVQRHSVHVSVVTEIPRCFLADYWTDKWRIIKADDRRTTICPIRARSIDCRVNIPLLSLVCCLC
ncbi:hypothetical protein LSH36_380g04055 [Paralvinella palmiformis]|uniref:Uncharacterized protein n=1 Tax=Paralvinella palmiformis TaxID=53620 RepID=A0AAD9JEP2_9ANNE|nr:hypothetical protein LSH36_380g04055 [Paralvinella palmiformis]